MNLFNRLAMVLLATLALVAGAAVLAIGCGWLGPETLYGAPAVARLAGEIRALPSGELLWASVGAGATALGGLLLLILEIRTPGGPAAWTVHRDRRGAVTVSFSGLRRLADHVVGELPGVEEVNSLARPTRSGVAFRCRVRVKPEVSTPELAEELRLRLGDAVRHHIGSDPARIDVLAQVGSLNGRKRVR